MQTAYKGCQFDGQDPRPDRVQLRVGANVNAVKDHLQVPLVDG